MQLALEFALIAPASNLELENLAGRLLQAGNDDAAESGEPRAYLEKRGLDAAELIVINQLPDRRMIAADRPDQLYHFEQLNIVSQRFE